MTQNDQPSFIVALIIPIHLWDQVDILSFDIHWASLKQKHIANSDRFTPPKHSKFMDIQHIVTCLFAFNEYVVKTAK